MFIILDIFDQMGYKLLLYSW